MFWGLLVVKLRRVDETSVATRITPGYAPPVSPLHPRTHLLQQIPRDPCVHKPPLKSERASEHIHASQEPSLPGTSSLFYTHLAARQHLLAARPGSDCAQRPPGTPLPADIHNIHIHISDPAAGLHSPSTVDTHACQFPHRWNMAGAGDRRGARESRAPADWVSHQFACNNGVFLRRDCDVRGDVDGLLGVFWTACRNAALRQTYFWAHIHWVSSGM